MYADEKVLQDLRGRVSSMLPWLKRAACLEELSIQLMGGGNAFVLGGKCKDGEVKIDFDYIKSREVRRFCTGDLSRAVLKDLLGKREALLAAAAQQERGNDVQESGQG